MSIKQKPNIFEYATSELSQDAFLAWLLDWANEKYQKTDEHLYACAVSFVRKLLGKPSSFAVREITVKRQKDHIDICAEINNKYLLGIEDKKGTTEHSDQLERNKETGKEYRCVYFKMEEQTDFDQIAKKGFSPFKRKEMLEICEKYSKHPKAKNNIMLDYCENLKKLDGSILSYKTLRTEEWDSNYSWQGFYSELKKLMIKEKDIDWEKTNNPSGGFYRFSWHYLYVYPKEAPYTDKNYAACDFYIYLQLENEKLTFKIGDEVEYTVTNKKIRNNKEKIRNTFREYLLNKAEELNFEIEQSGKLGKHMTVAKLPHDYRKTNNKGVIDIKKTIKTFEKAEKLLDETHKELKKHYKNNKKK